MHLLDNMIWNAITTGNRNLAMVDGDVGCYKPDIAPFAAMKEFSKENFDKLYGLIPPERKTIAISHLQPLNYEETKFTLLQNLPCCQMVYQDAVVSFSTPQSSRVVPLTEEHIPQMLELTALTKPGPFFQNTIRFGNYFGVFVDGQLAAMAGQRMHPTPFLEVSAVCTHPGFRGNGYAKACMLRVMELILDSGYTPFLHVLTTNTTAIQLYESIGFRIRTEIDIDVVKRNDTRL